MPSRATGLFRVRPAVAALAICGALTSLPTLAESVQCEAAMKEFFPAQRALAAAMDRRALCQRAAERHRRCQAEADEVERLRALHGAAEERAESQCRWGTVKAPRPIDDLGELRGFVACLKRRHLGLRPQLGRGVHPGYEVTTPRLPPGTTVEVVVWDLPSLLERERHGPGYSIFFHRNQRMRQAMSDPRIRGMPDVPSLQRRTRAVAADAIRAFADC